MPKDSLDIKVTIRRISWKSDNRKDSFEGSPRTFGTNLVTDHVYASDSAHMTDISVPNIAVSDHYPVSFTPTTTKDHFKRQEHISIQHRIFNPFDEDSFLDDLCEQINTSVISQTDTNANFSNWTSKFMVVLDKQAPMRQKRVKRETEPEWVNDEIQTAMKQRNKYQGLKDWRQYKYWRNKTIALIRKSKKTFLSRSINYHRDNTFLWRIVKSLSGQNDYRKNPDQITIDDVSYQNENDIIEQLNCFFQQFVTD